MFHIRRLKPHPAGAASASAAAPAKTKTKPPRHRDRLPQSVATAREVGGLEFWRSMFQR